MSIEFELMDWEGGCDDSGGKWRLAYPQWRISSEWVGGWMYEDAWQEAPGPLFVHSSW